MEIDFNRNLLKIMIASDLHLGFEESHPVRGLDSFAAFEEVLMKAKSNDVDFVLLGGDLFHDNKPSRSCIFRTMSILRRYCMGDSPVTVQIISDQANNFKTSFGWANYEDENLNVELPVLSIHGNHDDQSRDGGVHITQENQLGLSTLDMLHCAGLINYFGQVEEADSFTVEPILMQKGITKLAIYGIGSMRDEKLDRMLHNEEVKLKAMPGSDQSKDGKSNIKKEWFSILVLHQNRFSRTTNNSVREESIPHWLDLVVWGHEHECIAQLSESLAGTYRIIQPGSTVATSLSVGEANPKHCVILSLVGLDFKLHFEPLLQVRSLLLDEIFLSQEESLDQEKANIEEEISAVLERKVESILHEFLTSRKGNFTPLAKQEPEQPLVRITVHLSGFPSIANVRFGQIFNGRIANTSNILLFKKVKHSETSRKAGHDAYHGFDRYDTIHDIKAENLFREELKNSSNQLKILHDEKVVDALDIFASKQENSSIALLVKGNMKKYVKDLNAVTAPMNPSLILEEIMKLNLKYRSDSVSITNQLKKKSRPSEEVESDDEKAKQNILGYFSSFDENDECQNRCIEKSHASLKTSTSMKGRSMSTRGRATVRRGKATSTIAESLQYHSEDDIKQGKHYATRSNSKGKKRVGNNCKGYNSKDALKQKKIKNSSITSRECTFKKGRVEDEYDSDAVSVNDVQVGELSSGVEML